MMTPCSSCRRYIRETETTCPFCAKAKRRAGMAFVAAAALTGCQSTTTPQPEPAPPITTVEETPEAAPPATETPPGEPQPEAIAPPEPSAAPADSIAENTPPPAPTTTTPAPQRPPRPMVMRYGISPRLPPPSPPKQP